jgi:hypothetical protein
MAEYTGRILGQGVQEDPKNRLYLKHGAPPQNGEKPSSIIYIDTKS